MPPQTRASFAHSIQAAVATLPPADAQAIRSYTGAAWEAIATAPSVGWLDEAVYNALTESIRRVLGAERMQALFRQLGRNLSKNPSFQGLLEGAIRLLGLSPHTLLKVAPRGRNSVVRGSGSLTYKWIDARTARLILCDFPASTYRSGTTAILLSGTWLGLVDMAGCGATARVELRDVDLNAGNTTFVVTW